MNIEICLDDSLCERPPTCKKCLQVCPMSVFRSYPITDWKVLPFWTNLCTGCNLCVEACPKGAITMKVEEET